VVEFAFNFPSPKRERKLSDEEQVETKRPKSPGTGEEALKVLRDLQTDNRAEGQRMAERLAVMEKKKVLLHTTNLQADKTPFFATGPRSWKVVTGTRPQKGDNTFR
jgi:hypothetical protein